MELYAAIKGRRSIRKFLDKDIPREILERVLESAIWAPSGMNGQYWRFYVLKEEKRREFLKFTKKVFQKLKDVIKKDASTLMPLEVAEAWFTTLGRAPVVILAYSDPPSAIRSVTMACQNLLLACHAEGLGATFMSSPEEVEDEINEFMGIKGMKLVGAIPVGYPDPSYKAIAYPRKEGRIFWVEN